MSLSVEHGVNSTRDVLVPAAYNTQAAPCSVVSVMFENAGTTIQRDDVVWQHRQPESEIVCPSAFARPPQVWSSTGEHY